MDSYENSNVDILFTGQEKGRGRDDFSREEQRKKKRVKEGKTRKER